MSRASAILPCILLVALSGCSMFGGAPKGTPNLDVRYLLPPSVVVALDQQTLPPQTGGGPGPVPAAGVANVQTLLPECKIAYGYGAQPPTQADRNNCVMALMAMVDMQYGQFRDGLLRMVDSSDLAADVALLGLGGATTLVPGKTTKSILGAITTGITGTKTAVNSDILYNSSIIIIINQMDADRATQRCTILNELKSSMPSQATVTTPSTPTTLTLTMKTTVNSANAQRAVPATPNTSVTVNPSPPQTYGMYDASTDLIQYYEAGTFTHALQALEAKTGSQATASKQQATDVKTGTSTSNTTSTTTSTASTCSSS